MSACGLLIRHHQISSNITLSRSFFYPKSTPTHHQFNQSASQVAIFTLTDAHTQNILPIQMANIEYVAALSNGLQAVNLVSAKSQCMFTCNKHIACYSVRRNGFALSILKQSRPEKQIRFVV